MSAPEIPMDMREYGWMQDPTMPDTDIQALMQAAPGCQPEESREALQRFREAVADCMAALTPQEMFTLNSYEAERLSYSQLGVRLGCSKSQAEREHKLIYARLSAYLRAHPLIQERHHLTPTTWNQAAANAVYYMSTLANTTFPIPFDEAIFRGKQILSAGWEESGGKLTDILVALGVSSLNSVGNSEDTIVTIVNLLVERHVKYGVGNINEFKEYGLLVRMSDKVARINNNAGDFADEAVTDAYYDLVGYAAIAHMLSQDTFNLPLEAQS